MPRPLIAVAIAAHNRREKTLACIASLYAQKDLGQEFDLKIFLLDDASTDGTRAAVEAAFGDVTILNGTGSLYWGGGMNAAMTRALQENPDFILLLNDDVNLRASAVVSALLIYADLAPRRGEKTAIIGATTAPGRDEITYSGYYRSNRFHPGMVEKITTFDGAPVKCDTMNGNFVLIPRAITDVLGPIDNSFIHGYGDFDYGYRINQIGGETWIAPNPIGECAANDLRKLDLRGLTLREKWSKINSPFGLPFKSWTLFMYRHGGIMGLIILLGIYGKKLVVRR